MKSMIAALGCVLGAGALLGALAFSESRDVSTPLPPEQRFPEVCEKYVRAFETCNVDALKVSARAASNDRIGENDSMYVQRQLNQLRRELARVRASGGDDALVMHCMQQDFEEINYRLVNQIASSLLEVNAMDSVCATAVSAVIESYQTPVGLKFDSSEAFNMSSSAATIAAFPTSRK